MIKLRFDKKAIYRLEKEKDVKIGQLASLADPENFQMSIIVDLLWAGQLHKRPQLTTEQVLEDFDMDDIEQYVEPISEAMEEAFGDIEVDDDKKKSVKAASAG